MSCENYKQYDGRWASKRYAGDTMAGSGCGPTAVANIVSQLPTAVADYIESSGGTVVGHGTIWSFIDLALDHYGYNGQQLNGASLHGAYGTAAEAVFRNAMETGKYYGILLMGPGMFTSGGHYITITECRAGQYYVHDPASAARDGWHPWSDFAGDVKVFYLADRKDGTQITLAEYCFSVGTIQMGSVGIYVLLLQEILTARGYDTGGLDRIFGGKTEAAVKAYQKSRGFLEVDGVCGPATWADLLGLPKRNGMFILRTVKIGDNGPETLLLQEILKSRGYYSGPLDWECGNGTESGTGRYQADRGLQVDRICGPVTWKDLIGL